MEYKWVGNHSQDLASGRMLEPGETVELSEEEAAIPHNKSLIDEGGMILLDEKATQPNATPDAVELAEANSVDLAEVPGSGSAGRITKRDVETFLDNKGGDA